MMLQKSNCPLDFSFGYGCYCGPGGQGVPKDDYDKACQAHDTCFEDNKHCKAEDGSQGYYHLDFNFEWSGPKNQTITCTDPEHTAKPTAQGDCKRKICDCNKMFADRIRELLDEAGIKTMA